MAEPNSAKTTFSTRVAYAFAGLGCLILLLVFLLPFLLGALMLRGKAERRHELRRNDPGVTAVTYRYDAVQARPSQL